MLTIVEADKSSNFTKMSNYHLQDRELSLKAKGLMSFCLSLPPTWDFNIEGLTKLNRDGRNSIAAAVAELEAKGYIRRKRLRNANGTLGAAEYVIVEHPESAAACTPVLEKPAEEMPDWAEPAQDNATQLNTNLSRTKRSNNERKKDPRHLYGQYQNVLLTDEEHEKLMAEFPSDYDVRIERLSEYMASTGKSYKNHLITIRSWAHREAQNKQGYNRDAYRFKEGDSL